MLAALWKEGLNLPSAGEDFASSLIFAMIIGQVAPRGPYSP